MAHILVIGGSKGIGLKTVKRALEKRSFAALSRLFQGFSGLYSTGSDRGGIGERSTCPSVYRIR